LDLTCHFAVVNEDDEKKRTWRERLSSLGENVRRKTKRTFTRKLMFKRLPVLRWLPLYTLADGVGDLVAGITVGLTIIPQALAYANIAGLPPEVSAFRGTQIN
jgi:sodium-independent sulfate anion transporter 11